MYKVYSIEVCHIFEVMKNHAHTISKNSHGIRIPVLGI